MRVKKYWAIFLASWTLFLSLWTGICWNVRSAEVPGGEGAPTPRQQGSGPQKAAGAEDPEGPTAPEQEKNMMLDVPFIDQREKWPTGCESVSAVMALQYAGVDVTVDEFIDDCLPRGDAPHADENGELVGCDPRLAFPGDPRTRGGWGCFVPAILNAVETLLGQRESDLSIRDLTGSTLDELCENWIEQGKPVLVWGTIGMAEPWNDDLFRIEDSDEYYQWISPMHCLLLVGYGEEGFCFNDPMAGKQVFYSREACERAYKAMDCQAAVIL